MTLSLGDKLKCIECPLHKKSPENFCETFKKGQVYKIIEIKEDNNILFYMIGDENNIYGIPLQLAQECFEVVL